MGDGNCSTTTVTSESERLASIETTHACLFLAIQCDRPLAGPARYLLRGVQSVQFGRGGERRAPYTGRSGALRVSLQVPDTRMSSTHAELRRVGGGWELTDTGSKNGTFVNGDAISTRLLADGDLV